MLIKPKRSLLAFLAVIALVIAQSAAGVHALKHLVSQGDAGAPAQHAPLCLDCVSFAPLAGAHGGTAGLPVIARVTTLGVLPALGAAYASKRLQSPLQARAPPR